MHVYDFAGKYTVLLFVYGTLQRSENNYPYWMADPEHAKFVARARTQKFYPLFVNLLPVYRGSSPCLLDVSADEVRERGLHQVVGDLFLVTETLVKWLDILEDVENGTYGSGEIDVVPLENDQTVKDLFGACAGETLRAMVYFRRSHFPTDWDSPTPRSSTPLMSRFSASECLRLWGSRFEGVPAHLQDGVEMQEAINRVGALCEGAHGAPMRPKPIVLFIIDGIGDATYPELGNRTPLEVVAGVMPRSVAQPDETPPLDMESFFADGINVVTRNGVSGLMDVFQAGTSCGSDTAHLALFGYPPTEYYRGRGAYEALGAGLKLADGDIAFKSNFAVIDEATGIVTHRRCDRNFTKEGPVLCEFLDGTVLEGDEEGKFVKPHTIRVQYATEHRCGVAITGEGLSHFITGTDPLADGRQLLSCQPTVSKDHTEYEAALYTSRVLNAASRRITELLRTHPINETRRSLNKLASNVVLLRGAANKGWVPSFVVRHGLEGCIVAPTCIIKGLGICCGLKGVIAEGTTGDYNTNVNAKVDAALRELGIGPGSSSTTTTATTNSGSSGVDSTRHCTFAVIHVKGVDDAGHDRNLEKKLSMLKKCGNAMQRLWDALPDGSTMAVIADHSTPLSVGDHSCEPVPVSVATKRSGGTGAFRDGVAHYSEIECAGGALGRFRGDELMGVLKRAHHWYHYMPHGSQ